MSNMDQNVTKVLGVVCHLPQTELVSHSNQGFFSNVPHTQSDAVQESYSPAFMGSSGGGVWVRAIIGIEPSELAV